jgi:flavodoxin
MKVLVVFDSVYGNTEKVARAIGAAITGEVKVIRASEFNPSDVEAIDLCIIGSPPREEGDTAGTGLSLQDSRIRP